jgi:NADPH-dependent F420 reductase
MKIAVIGTGNMGTALARGIASADHELIIGARNVDKATALAKEIGAQAEAGGISAAIKAAELVVMALPYEANLAALKGVDASGKILVDVSNPITADFKDLIVGHTTSAAEELQAHAPGARVVKAFNTIFSALLPSAARNGTALQVFLASNDADAKKAVESVVRTMGFAPVDAGPLRNSRFLEPMGEMNIHFGFFLGWGTVAAPVWQRV